MVGAKILMKGNEAIAEAAIRAGCQCFFGYPITPQNEIPEYMAKRMPQVGRVFLQAESEISAINMVYGAGGAGARVMTSSSGPGISLKQEGISYMVGSEIPCVIVNIMRAGPGLGGIQPSQGDYFQATRGGGHGDYRLLVLAPSSVQEAVELMMCAFDLADKYRNPVMLLGDAVVGQMMEPVEFPDVEIKSSNKPWATTGAKGRSPNIINSLYLNDDEFEKHNLKIQEKYNKMKEEELRVELYKMDDADAVLVAYGTVARICKSAIDILRKDGVNVGLIRPITLYPFPEDVIKKYARKVKYVLTVELSLGQLVDDVRLSVAGKAPVGLIGTTGGKFPTPRQIAGNIKQHMGGEESGRIEYSI